MASLPCSRVTPFFLQVIFGAGLKAIRRLLVTVTVRSPNSVGSYFKAIHSELIFIFCGGRVGGREENALSSGRSPPAEVY